MNNPIIRDLIQCTILAVVLIFIQKMCVTMNISVDNAYMIGALVGILICYCVNLLSAIVMNVTVTLKSLSYTPEEFAKFLKEFGCKADFTVIDTDNKEDGKNE